jgi:serine/threonine-protein phosphatase 2B catalytic subunit
MLCHIIKLEDFKIEKDNENETSTIEEVLSESIRMKVKFLTIIMKMYKTVREERELILKLKGCCPGNKIPRGLILQGPNALRGAYERYNKAKVYDIVNEKRPTEQDEEKLSKKEYLDD